jgi:hypothetical protein
MDKKKKFAKKVEARKSVIGSESSINKTAWFRRRDVKSDGWGFIPINWKGYVSLILLIGLNVFSANYFNLNELVVDSYLKMGVVFLLSIFVFIEIAKYKTLGGRR